MLKDKCQMTHSQQIWNSESFPQQKDAKNLKCARGVWGRGAASAGKPGLTKWQGAGYVKYKYFSGSGPSAGRETGRLCQGDFLAVTCAWTQARSREVGSEAKPLAPLNMPARTFLSVHFLISAWPSA